MKIDLIFLSLKTLIAKMSPMEMKRVFLFIMSGFFLFANAQQRRCGTTEVNNKILKEHPELLQKQTELEQFTQQYIGSSKKTTGQIYIIPVVFHILHNYGPENILDEQVIDAVRILNEDFRKQNTDITTVVPAFQGITADCEIEFRLAQKDPNGECTNGIDRIITPLTSWANDDAKLNQWPRDKYLNIWTVKGFDLNQFGGGVLGYSYRPASVHYNSAIDGIMILHNALGSVGTGNINYSRSLTHEVGHYLNLAHPWGSTNSPGVACDDDGISDTPITKGWTDCNLTSSAVCTSNIQENVQNYMEYSGCSNMYTQGQKDRMQATLNSFTASRKSLWGASNLFATGTNDSFSQICAPKADFYSDATLVCAGAQVAFTDLSWNGEPTTWTWSFPGGTPDTSTGSDPVVQYNTPGTYDVTLIASNSTGSGDKTKTAIITVYPDIAAYNSWQYADSFENGLFPNADWKVSSSGGSSWQQTSSAAASGNSSVSISNSEFNQGQTSEMISPSINLSAISQPTLRFKLANAQISSSSDDKLEVYVSTNCGGSWSLTYVKRGINLSTAGEVLNSFVPNSSQWREEAINISFYADQSSVYFKFKFTSGGGNNIYIDDINISGPLGVDEILNNTDVSAFPNPADESMHVILYLAEKQEVNIKLYDLLGKEVFTIAHHQQLSSGEHRYLIQKEELINSGIYLLRLQAGDQVMNKKIVFE